MSFIRTREDLIISLIKIPHRDGSEFAYPLQEGTRQVEKGLLVLRGYQLVLSGGQALTDCDDAGKLKTTQ